MTATPTALRADARRNREKVLAAAETLFAGNGISVTLEKIARSAGVGAGTVYRHFPTKEALYAAVTKRRVVRLADEAVKAAKHPDPVAGFDEYLAYLMEHALLNQDLCDAQSPSEDWHLVADSTPHCILRESFAILLRRAQRAGGVRGDIDADAVLSLVPAYTAMVRHLGSRDNARAALAILWDGLHLTAATDTKRNPETKQRTSSTEVKRNETPVLRHCEVCGTPIEAASTGRPAKYCGPACRLRAHRSRGQH